MRLARLALTIAFIVATEHSRAQFQVTPGETGADGCAPATPARICFRGTDTPRCYSPTSDKNYIFGLEPYAKTVGQLDGQPLVLFTAMFSGCGSGTLTDVSLLTFRKGNLVNLLPEVRISNQSDQKFWSLPQISDLPVLAMADFIWDFKAEETHFSFHRYLITAFVFDPESGKYLQRVRYETVKKYPGLDETNSIQVLNAEKSAIVAKLPQPAK